MAQYRERTRAVQHAYEGKEDVLPLLMECFKREEVGAWRATLLDLMDAWAHEPAVQEVAAAAVKDPDPLTRAAAAKVMGRVGNPAAGKLLNDPFRVVRLQAEWALRDSLPPDSPGMKELTAAALHQADQPSGAMKLAQIAISRKDVKTAELWFSKALNGMPLHPWCTVIMPFSWLLKAAAGRRWIRCKRLYAWLPGMPICGIS